MIKRLWTSLLIFVFAAAFILLILTCPLLLVDYVITGKMHHLMWMQKLYNYIDDEI